MALPTRPDGAKASCEGALIDQKVRNKLARPRLANWATGSCRQYLRLSYCLCESGPPMLFRMASMLSALAFLINSLSGWPGAR
jgi:hypothetical protein